MELALGLSSRFDLADHPGTRHGLVALGSFLVTFLITRFWVRMQRSGPDWWPNSVKTGDTHVHHLVPGIFLIVIAGFLALIGDSDKPWYEVVAVAFGAGAALTLDEYALWLHLEDVYWAEEGRHSVDVIAVAFGLGLLVVIGATPFGLGGDSSVPTTALLILVAIDLITVVFCALKGKLYMAGFGIFIPLVSIIGAWRPARPGSWWARRHYGDRPDLAERGRIADEKWSGRRTRWWDAVAGRHGS